MANDSGDDAVERRIEANDRVPAPLQRRVLTVRGIEHRWPFTVSEQQCEVVIVDDNDGNTYIKLEGPGMRKLGG